MLKFEAHNFVEDSDFDELVIETYGRPYCFQQQEGCRDRGTERFTIPISGKPYDYEQDQIPEVINGEEMGVSFAAWLARDPKAPVKDEEGGGTEDWEIEMFWQRNFYPSIETVVQDLYERGLIPAGKYIINIDW